MAWVILFCAGLFETGWAIGLKYTDGFTRLWPTVWTVFAMIISLWLLGIPLERPTACGLVWGQLARWRWGLRSLGNLRTPLD